MKATDKKMKEYGLKHKIVLILLGCLMVFSGLYGQEECDLLIREAIGAAQKKDYARSFELLAQAQKIADNKNLPKQRFWILTNIGINQAEMLDYSGALDNFLEAYKIALEKLDVRSEMSIMNNIAGLYMLDSKFEKANEYFKKIYYYAKSTKDSLFVGGCAMNIVITANLMDNIKESEEYLDVASEMLQNYPEELLRVQSLAVSLLSRKKEYKAAERQGLLLFSRLNTIENQELKAEVAAELARIYQQTHDFGNALLYAKEALASTANLESRRNLFNLLSELYEENGDYIKALDYKDSLICASDSLYRIRNKKRFERSRIQFELLKNGKELSDNKDKLRTIAVVLFLFACMGTTLIWALRNKSERDRQRKKIMELELDQEKNKKLLLENRLKEQEALRLLQQERLIRDQETLKQKIELKNKELTSQASFLINRNKLIESLIASLAESQIQSADPAWTRNIQQLKNQLKDNREWNSFIAHFEQTNQKFIITLRERHPELTGNEIRFLSFIYLDLDIKEIASLMNITPDSCKKKKWLISQKIGLSSTTLLHEYLRNF